MGNTLEINRHDLHLVSRDGTALGGLGTEVLFFFVGDQPYMLDAAPTRSPGLTANGNPVQNIHDIDPSYAADMSDQYRLDSLRERRRLSTHATPISADTAVTLPDGSIIDRVRVSDTTGITPDVTARDLIERLTTPQTSYAPSNRTYGELLSQLKREQ